MPRSAVSSSRCGTRTTGSGPALTARRPPTHDQVIVWRSDGGRTAMLDLTSWLDQCGRELTKRPQRRVRRLVGADLDADLVGAAVEVCLNAPDDSVDIAPGNDRVDEAVAAVTDEVGIAPAQSLQVVHVVWQREIALGKGASYPAPFGRVSREHGRLLDQERFGAEVPAGERRVFDGDEVGMGTVGALGGEPREALRRVARLPKRLGTPSMRVDPALCGVPEVFSRGRDPLPGGLGLPELTQP
jgi:hypothetical protein